MLMSTKREQRQVLKSFNAKASNNVTAIASFFEDSVKASSNILLGAWSSMELKTEGSNRNSAMQQTWLMRYNCVQLSSLMTTWKKCPGGIDWELVSETQKRQQVEATRGPNTFAKLGTEIKEWVQTQLN